MELYCCLHSGHSVVTFDHLTRQGRQNSWKHLLLLALVAFTRWQIAHIVSRVYWLSPHFAVSENLEADFETLTFFIIWICDLRSDFLIDLKEGLKTNWETIWSKRWKCFYVLDSPCTFVIILLFDGANEWIVHDFYEEEHILENNVHNRIFFERISIITKQYILCCPWCCPQHPNHYNAILIIYLLLNKTNGYEIYCYSWQYYPFVWINLVF